MYGSILHADLDAFFASVEQRDDPALRGRPVIVGGGVVMASSYEARACGVRTAMGGRQALRLCPDAIVVPPRMHAYTEASRRVFEVFHDTTPVVEGISVDEAFLDVSGLERLKGSSVGIAQQLRRDVRDRVGLPITVGVARTKFLAKVASGVGKPDGLLAVPVEDELTFLHALPVERLWGVGKVTSAALHQHRVATVGDVAALTEGELVAILGGHAGRHLHALAHGRDPRRVTHTPRRRSMGSQHAMGRGDHSAADLDATLLALVDRVMRRLRSAGRTGSTVMLRFRFDDFTRATRSRSLPRPTDHTDTVVGVARGLLEEMRPTIERDGITLLGFTIGNLDDHGLQMVLPLDADPPETGSAAQSPAVDAVLDAVRERFGSKAVQRAVQMHRVERDAMPTLPDQA